MLCGSVLWCIIDAVFSSENVYQGSDVCNGEGVYYSDGVTVMCVMVKVFITVMV